MILGFGQNETGITDSGPLPLAQLPVIPSSTTPPSLTISTETPPAQLPSNPTTYQDVLNALTNTYNAVETQFLGSTGTTTPSTGISTGVLILMVAGFGIFLMAISGSGGRRR